MDARPAERWQLPDGIEELLPGRAGALESARRQLLDHFQRWGYQFVIPPLLEFADSLLVGLGEDLDLQTFKIIDQLSGRMLGIRADITPQTARMDAHSLAHSGAQRLCYAGSVLHANPSGLKASRAPIKAGAELYGVADVQGDIEIISLMLDSLQQLGLQELTLDLGHVGFFRNLIDNSGLQTDQAQVLFALLQTKALSDLEVWLSDNVSDAGLQRSLLKLAQLNGGREVLTTAREMSDNVVLHQALDDLDSIAETVIQRFPQVSLYFDLGELRGFNYHSGLVFAAYSPGVGRAVANGGRYDDIGAAFGRARPATGFNTDLKTLLSLLPEPPATEPGGVISAPASADAGLWAAVQQLRAAGETVVYDFDDEQATGRQLTQQADGRWVVE